MKFLQARILEWVAIPFSRKSWDLNRDWTWVSGIVGRFFTTEPPGKPFILYGLVYLSQELYDIELFYYLHFIDGER